MPGLRKTVLKHLKLVLVRHLISPLFTSAYCFCTVPCAIFHASSHRGAFQHKPMVAIKRHNVSMVVFTSVFPAVYGCTKNGTVGAYKGKIWKKKIKLKKPRKQILIDVWTDSRCVFLWKSKIHPNKGKEKTGTNLPLQNTLNYIVPSKQVVIVKREMKKSNTIKHLETFRDKDLIKRTEKFLFTMLAA